MTHTSFLISRAGADDAAALSAIGRETFAEKFGHLYTPENLETFLEQSHSPQWYAYALSQEDVGIWVARSEGEALIAYAVAGPNTLPVPEPGPHDGEIKRVYVQKEWQGRGIGGQLQTVMIDWLQARGHEPLYVGVYSDNHGAQRLYQRYGFEKVGEYIFPVGTHEDREFIMRRKGGA